MEKMWKKVRRKCMKTNTDLFEKVPVPKAVATMAFLP